MSRLNFLPLLLFFFIQFSCNAKKSEIDSHAQAPSAKIAISYLPGTLQERISCREGSPYSFALYLPQSFQKGKQFPLLLLFDPHGDGAHPLRLYRDLADRYGYVLMGSNDSKNGNSGTESKAIIESLEFAVSDLLQGSIAQKNIGGFSGGARVASLAAFSGNDWQTLISCGAGFQQENWKGNSPNSIVGIAGDADMNLHELMDLKFTEPQKESSFHFIRFNGKHNWPDEAVMEQAFLCMESSRLKAQANKADNVSRLVENWNKLESQQEHNLIYQAAFLKNKIMCLEGLTNLATDQTKHKSLVVSPEYAQAVEQDRNLLKEEEQIRQTLIASFGKADTTWWINSMRMLHKEKSRANEARAAMLARATGSLSLICYMNLNQAFKGNDMNALSYLCTLYRNVDPENPEAWYLSAKYEAMMQQPLRALEDLQKAVDNGFKDRQRMTNEMQFMGLQRMPEFQKIITTLSN